MRKHYLAFTLIELLIVIAILSILISIAIPNYWKTRINAFNATCESDISNFRLFLESTYILRQIYPDAQRNMTTGQVTFTVGNDNTETISFLTSTKVYIAYNTDSQKSSYVVIAKHIGGDTYYGVDSDSPLLYYKKNKSYVGHIDDVQVPESNPGVVEFDGSWSVK